MLLELRPSTDLFGMTSHLQHPHSRTQKFDISMPASIGSSGTVNCASRSLIPTLCRPTVVC